MNEEYPDQGLEGQDQDLDAERARVSRQRRTAGSSAGRPNLDRHGRRPGGRGRGRAEPPGRSSGGGARRRARGGARAAQGHPGRGQRGHALTATRARLDAELVRRGLARSREQAGELVAAGRVAVAGQRAAKAATQVTPGRADQRRRHGRAGVRLPRRAQAGRGAGGVRPGGPGGGGPGLPGRGRVHRRVHRRAAAGRRRARGGGRRGVRPAGLVAADRPAGHRAGPGQRADPGRR